MTILHDGILTMNNDEDNGIWWPESGRRMGWPWHRSTIFTWVHHASSSANNMEAAASLRETLACTEAARSATSELRRHSALPSRHGLLDDHPILGWWRWWNSIRCPAYKDSGRWAAVVDQHGDLLVPRCWSWLASKLLRQTRTRCDGRRWSISSDAALCLGREVKGGSWQRT
jgi:hypothetical protein